MTNRKWNVEEYLRISSGRALQVDGMHSRLQKLFGGEEGEANEEAMLSPMDRVKYYNLREKLGKVKVAHIYAKAETIDLAYFHLSAYTGLRELILDMVPPSTVLDFISLRDRLVSLEIVNAGIPDMAKALANGVNRALLKDFMPMVLQRSPSSNEKRNSISAPEFSAYKWNNLTLLRLRNCGICSMDASLHLFPAVTSVDLSHNQISNVVHLQDCHWLSELDLSYNRITVLSNFSRVVGNLLVLNLCNNHITNLDGIEKMYALESLNLAYNEIDDENEVRLLTRLPCLEMIDLLGNPISEETSYREFFFLQFLVDGQIQRSGRDLPMLDNEPMTESELKLLRGQLFRAPDDQYADLSHLDHDVDGNITRGSLSDRESEAASGGRARGDSTLSSNGGGRGRSGSSAPQRLSALSDMSMRELAATLRGDGSFSPPPPTDANGLPSEGRSSFTGHRERSTSGAKVQNLHGINNTKYALLSPTSFDANSKKETGKANGSENMDAASSSKPNSASSRGSPTRKAKTKYESISTDSGDELYVRRTKAGKRVPKAQLVVVEITGAHNASNDVVDVKQMLQETTMRIAQASGKNVAAKEFFPDLDDGTESTYNFSPVKSISPPPASVYGSPAERGHSDNSSLANTPQIFHLHETHQERENVLRESTDRITEGTRESSEHIAGRQASVASVESDNDFNIGDLGAPSSARREEEDEDGNEESSTVGSPTKTSHQEKGAGADTELSFEMERSRLISRDMPLDQRMRMLSVMSSDEGSSRQDSIDSMSTSGNITQLRSSVLTFNDAPVVRGTENARERHSDLGMSPGEVPSVFLASMAERAEKKKEKEKEGKRKEKTPISSLLGSLGMASTPVSSGNNTPSGTPSRSEDHSSSPPRRGSQGRESEGSQGSKSSKALAAAASLTAKWAAKAAAASASSPANSFPDIEPPDRDFSTISQLTTSTGRPTTAAIHTNAIGVQSLSGVPQGDEVIDDFASRYAGNVDYRRLRVVENLELYLKEQVFRVHKDREDSLYLGWGEEEDGVLVKRSAESEVFLACFAEIVHACGRSVENDTVSKDGSTSVGSGSKKKDKKKSKSAKEDPDGMPERRVLMVLSTEVLYFVDIDITPTVTFDKAPLLRVIWAHSLHSLAACTVYFGFQRCLLEFSSAIAPGEEGETPYSFGDSPNHQYMIITREKSHTHPIITKIPKAANAARTANSGTHDLTGADNVQIYNRDSQLLDAVVDFAESKSQGKTKHDPDVAHYQMLHQLWRKRPGVSAPRSVVVTSTLLLLCSENLLEQDVKLTVLDSSPVSDVSKIVAEDADATCVTIIFKSASFGITQRKWRLRLKSTAAATKFLSDIRNVKDM